MLKGISPLLNAEVLFALRAMGHGDDLIVADTNFPADSVARQTELGELLRIDNVSAAEAVAAVLSYSESLHTVSAEQLRSDVSVNVAEMY